MDDRRRFSVELGPRGYVVVDDQERPLPRRPDGPAKVKVSMRGFDVFDERIGQIVYDSRSRAKARCVAETLNSGADGACGFDARDAVRL